jgi:hypothetical protein
LLAPAPAPRATSTHEQPRLFEPQYEGQLDMSGDNPEEAVSTFEIVTTFQAPLGAER